MSLFCQFLFTVLIFLLSLWADYNSKTTNVTESLNMSEQEIMLQNAQNLMSRGEYEEGIKLLRQLGDNPTALKLLGVAYYYGYSIEEDDKKALEYFVAAYEHGERDIGFYETIHDLIQENLSEFKKNKCDFKDDIAPIYKLLKGNLDAFTQSSRPFDDSTQFYFSMEYMMAFKNCCEIIKVFLVHQNIDSDLTPRNLFLEGMKLGLVELEFVTDVIYCRDKISEECDFSITNQIEFTKSIMVMRMFMERVDEVINNKTDAEILKEIFENSDRNKR